MPLKLHCREPQSASDAWQVRPFPSLVGAALRPWPYCSNTAGLTAEQFESDELDSDAVLRNFELLGEAAK